MDHYTTMRLLTLLNYEILPTLERKVSIMILLTLMNYDTTNLTYLQHPRRIQGVKS